MNTTEPKNGNGTNDVAAQARAALDQEERKPTGRPRRDKAALPAGEIVANAASGKKALADIVPIETKTIVVEVVGDSSLMISRFDQKVMRQISDEHEGKGKKKKAPQDPFAEYNAARHLNERGEDCVPAVAFKHACVSATSFLPAATKMVIKGAMFISAEDGADLIPIKYTKEKVNGKSGPTMDSRMVRVGPFGNRKPMTRHRPLYRDWSAKLRIQFDASVLTHEQVVNLVNRSGFNCGVGENRPLGKESTGPNGRFHVK